MLLRATPGVASSRVRGAARALYVHRPLLFQRFAGVRGCVAIELRGGHRSLEYLEGLCSSPFYGPLLAATMQASGPSGSGVSDPRPPSFSAMWGSKV